VSGLTGRISGEIYCLTSTPGTLTTTIPTTGILKPVYVATSTTEVFINQGYPVALNTEFSQFNLATNAITLTALQIQTFTIDIPNNRFLGVSVEVTGLGSGETCKVQFSGTTAHVTPQYVSNFSDTLSIDNAMGWRYRDEDSVKKVHIKVENTTTAPITIQVRLKGEPF